MKKLVMNALVLGMLVLGFTSCENNNVNEETFESETLATGQGEVGDPVEEQEEEGNP
ncbi:hypothetical protein [Aquimarina sp. 2201CG5-10]|uniref:hypothetical protein n=1 Tax=Aquimarina callyspongiae TaxID=3098150 RepID=UPI002AB5B526|nr:hypothetical protein [Aquimarina sp. 2201CG5-10]MDY8137613.1 hypothetical protein [Aquimarina sp. 2201CG5-10]